MTNDLSRLLGRPLDRRAFLRRSTTAVAGVSLFGLAACGEDGNGAAPATTAPATTAPATTAPATTAPAAPSIGGELDFMGWQGEDLPGAMAAFAEANGITVNPTYMASSDDIDARFSIGGGGGLDILSYTSGTTPQFEANERTLAPIDTSRIPNFENLYSVFTGDPQSIGLANSKGEWVMIPHSFGAFGITYDSAAIDEPQAWADLLTPEFEGRITMPGDPGGNFAMGCRLVDLNPFRCPKDRMEDVADVIRPFISQSKTIAPSYGDVASLLASGEVVAAYLGWAALDIFATFAGVDTIRTNVNPEEGTTTFIDGYGIAQGTDNEDTVYAWINEVLDPAINGAAATELAAGATVDGSVEFIDPTTAGLYPYDDLEGFFENAPAFLNAPAESDEFVTAGEWAQRFTALLGEG